MTSSRQLTRRNALRMMDTLMQDPTERSEGLTPFAASLRREHEAWTGDSKIIGYGCPGLDSHRDSRKGGIAAVIYTESDDDAAYLRDKVIPESLTLESGGASLPVQVVSLGVLQPFMPTSRNRPLRPGVSISHCNMTAGTLGAFAKRRESGDTHTYVLSCNHVLTEYNSKSVDDRRIIQPGKFDHGRPPHDLVAELAHFVELRYDDRQYLNKVDAAIGRLVGDGFLPDEGRGMSALPISRTVRRNTAVHMTGRTSGLNHGVVRDSSARILLRYPRGARSTSKVGFEDVVLCSPFTRKGDSGALVFNPRKEVVGMVVGGGDRATIFCKIGYICDLLNIEITSGGA